MPLSDLCLSRKSRPLKKGAILISGPNSQDLLHALLSTNRVSLIGHPSVPSTLSTYSLTSVYKAIVNQNGTRHHDFVVVWNDPIETPEWKSRLHHLGIKSIAVSTYQPLEQLENLADLIGFITTYSTQSEKSSKVITTLNKDQLLHAVIKTMRQDDPPLSQLMNTVYDMAQLVGLSSDDNTNAYLVPRIHYAIVVHPSENLTQSAKKVLQLGQSQCVQEIKDTCILSGCETSDGMTECSYAKCRCQPGYCSDGFDHCVPSRCFAESVKNRDATLKLLNNRFGLDFSRYSDNTLACLRCTESVPSWNKTNIIFLSNFSSSCYREPKDFFERYTNSEFKVLKYLDYKPPESACLAPNDSSCHNTVLGIIYRNTDKALIIGFRGTKEVLNVFTHLKGALKPNGSNPEVLFHRSNINVHLGWLESFLIVKNEIKSVVDANIGQINVIYLTGHSLGGALSVITACYLRTHYPALEHKIKIVTFGCPKVGDKPFSMYYDYYLPDSLFMVNNGDIVTQVPPSLLGYEITKHRICYDDRDKKWHYQFNPVGGLLHLKEHKLGEYQPPAVGCEPVDSYNCHLPFLPENFKDLVFHVPESFYCVKNIK